VFERQTSLYEARKAGAECWDLQGHSGLGYALDLILLRIGRASVAIRRLVRSYVRMSAGQEPAGKTQLDRDQLFARDRFSTDRVFLCVYVFAHPQVE
jgi:hypothetical protein